MTEAATFEGWAILELMGHRRLAGYVSEQLVAGSSMLRLDVFGPKGGGTPARVTDARGSRDAVIESPIATQFYSPSALYCLTPTTEETARSLATTWQPEPVQRWELPAPREPTGDFDFDDADLVS